MEKVETKVDPSALNTFAAAINTKRPVSTIIVDGTIQVTYGTARNPDPRRNDLVELGDRAIIALVIENKGRTTKIAPKPLSEKAVRIQKMLATVAAAAADYEDDAPDDEIEPVEDIG